MSKEREVSTASRRSFLKSAGLAAGAAGVAATAVGSGSDEASAATAKSPTSVGYRETDHVRKVYELSKF